MNINTLIPFHKNALSTAVCLGLVAMSPNVQAVILNANTSATAGTTVTNTATNPTAVSITSYNSTTPSIGTARSKAAGNDTGWMYTYAGGSGTFSSMGNIQQVVNFTNTSAFAQSYAFDFTINFGSLNAFTNPAAGAGQFTTASNKVSIKLNGVEIFGSEATLTADNTGAANLATTGTVLGTYTAGSNYYSWSPFSGTLDLGIFNVGDSFTLEYDIFTLANSNAVIDPATCSTGYGAYGELGIIGFGGEGGYGFCEPSSSYTQFGDPNGISSMPINTSTVTGSQASVPEESSFLLFGAGLAGLAFTRRRRNRKH